MTCKNRLQKFEDSRLFDFLLGGFTSPLREKNLKCPFQKGNLNKEHLTMWEGGRQNPMDFADFIY